MNSHQPRNWKNSVQWRIGLVMGAIVLLALGSILSATIFAEQSTGKAAAINIAGSLRMQSLTLAKLIAQRAGLSGDDLTRSTQALALATGEFELRLNHAALRAALPIADAPDSALSVAYRGLSTRWAAEISPQVVATAKASSARALDGSGSLSSDAQVHESLANFVREIDRFVSLLEADLEGRIQLLRTLQGIAFFLIVIAVIVAAIILQQQVVAPLTDLVRVARRIREGDMSARAASTGEDELGELGSTFNLMMEQLWMSYRHLEERVAEKTHALQISSQSLELLYNTTRRLSEGAASRTALDDVLASVQSAVGAFAGVICTRPDQPLVGPARVIGVPLVKRSTDMPAHDPCMGHHCAQCFATEKITLLPVTHDSLKSVDLVVPITDSGHAYGEMILRLPAGHSVEDWQIKLVESVGHHIGAALAVVQRSEDRHRLALLDERTAIARELHDSLAQSLSYLKIQVARLAPLLAASNVADSSAPIVDELRTGIALAYRQLRELLTTFRLGMNGKGLSAALEEAASEFRERNKLEIVLDNALMGPELSANEEVHVLQIVREALSNVVHHAHASRVEVRLQMSDVNRVRVSIDDNGKGISRASPPKHHFGMAIMRDRAESLGGTINFAARADSGTTVELTFVAHSRFPEHHRLDTETV